MSQLIIVQPQSNGQVTIQVAGVPELQASAPTKEEAVQKLRALLEQWLASGQLMEIDLPGDNPLLKWAGHIDPNDPGEQIYLEELARLKREDLERTLREYEQECSDSSSTPTT